MFPYFSKGYTLVELMITLAVAAIISAIAVPAYRDHLLRARIPEATSTLSALALHLEQHYQDHRRYGDEKTCGAAMPTNEHFTFQCDLQDSGQSFTLTATGKASMAGFVFQTDQNGNARTTGLPADWGETPANCWIAKRGATC